MQYGTTSGQYSSSANATFDTYTASQMCGGEAATTGYLFPGEYLSVCVRVKPLEKTQPCLVLLLVQKQVPTHMGSTWLAGGRCCC